MSDEPKDDKEAESSFQRMLKRPVLWCRMCAWWRFADLRYPCGHATSAYVLSNGTTFSEVVGGRPN